MSEERQMLYVGCALSGELYTATLALSTGELEYVAHAHLPGLGQPGGAMPLAVSRADHILYAVSRGEPFFIASFMIDRDGKLHHIDSTPIETNLAYIELTADNKSLLCASFIDHHVSFFDVRQDHSVAPDRHQVREILKAHAMSMAPDDRTVLATSLGQDRIYQWQWAPHQAANDTGQLLRPIDELELPIGTGPRHIAYHPRWPIAYIIGERNGTISVICYGTEGLYHSQTVSLPNQNEAFQAADIHVTPDGRFLYASEKSISTLNLFNVHPDGKLVFEQQFLTESRPRGFAISADGNYLVAAGQFSHHIASYRIDRETGYLKIINRLPVGKSPDWITIL